MKVNYKRSFSACLLLAVYLPMFFVASLHVHVGEPAMEDECLLCAEQVPHVGHVHPARVSFHDCALCLFLGMSCVAVPLMILGCVRPRLPLGRVLFREDVLLRWAEQSASRAPPFVS